jgi:hypothetical protein
MKGVSQRIVFPEWPPLDFNDLDAQSKHEATAPGPLMMLLRGIRVADLPVEQPPRVLTNAADS